MICDTTTYSITAEDGSPTTIALQKLVADFLQMKLSDVHAWVQASYDRVAERRPDLSRRKKGDLVRAMSLAEAERTPGYTNTLTAMFGAKTIATRQSSEAGSPKFESRGQA